MIKIRFFKSFPLLVLGFLVFTTIHTEAQTPACPDCREQHEAVVEMRAAFEEAKEEVASEKENIENQLNVLRTINGNKLLNFSVEQILSNHIQESECTIPSADSFSEIETVAGGLKGNFFNRIYFHCPTLKETETFLHGFEEGEVRFSIVNFLDQSLRNQWPTTAAAMVSLEGELDNYTTALSEYHDAQQNWLDCFRGGMQDGNGSECRPNLFSTEPLEISENFNEERDCQDCETIWEELSENRNNSELVKESIQMKQGDLTESLGKLDISIDFGQPLQSVVDTAGCSTEENFSDIFPESKEVAGFLYGSTFHCSSEGAFESLIAELEMFWETTPRPSKDLTTLEQIDSTFEELEMLQDAYHIALEGEVTLSDAYRNCADTLLSLQTENLCLNTSIGQTSAVQENQNINADDEQGNENTNENENSNLNQNGETNTDPVTETRADFPDVQDHWSQTYVEALGSRGIVSGNPDGSFKPDEPISRAAVAKILALMLQLEVVDCIEKPFLDVEIDDWFCPYISAVKEAQVFQGYDDGTFRPGVFINRAEAVAAVLRAVAVNLDNDNMTGNFTDIPADAWFANFVSKAQQLGIVSGRTATEYAPAENVTRAEFSKIAGLGFHVTGKLYFQEFDSP